MLDSLHIIIFKLMVAWRLIMLKKELILFCFSFFLLTLFMPNNSYSLGGKAIFADRTPVSDCQVQVRDKGRSYTVYCSADGSFSLLSPPSPSATISVSSSTKNTLATRLPGQIFLDAQQIVVVPYATFKDDPRTINTQMYLQQYKEAHAVKDLSPLEEGKTPTPELTNLSDKIKKKEKEKKEKHAYKGKGKAKGRVLNYEPTTDY